MLLAWAAPGAAILPAGPATTSAPAADSNQPIETVSSADADARIAERLRGIFAEIPALDGVTVSADEGVVTLSGLVPSVEDRQRAASIAQRVSGVVAVENGLERDVSVDGGLAGLGGLSDFVARAIAMLPLIGAALVVALAIAALGYLLAWLTGLWLRAAPNSFLAELVRGAVRFVFVLGGIVVALNILGAGALMGAVLGGAGLIGIALGFAMRDTIENYVASLMLSLRQPFRANEHVVIDQHEGRVIRLTSRATILMTLDGNHLRIPNSAVFKAVILNYTRNPKRRFEFVLGIDADDDPTAALSLGVEILGRLPFVLAEPEPMGTVEEVGDSNILIRFIGWIDQEKSDWLKARSRAIPAVKEALEEAGFAIPEPIYRLRFDTASPLPMEGIKAAEPRKARKPAQPHRPTVEEHAAADIRPESEIAKMVEAERTSTTGEQDLLDSTRPVE